MTSPDIADIIHGFGIISVSVGFGVSVGFVGREKTQLHHIRFFSKHDTILFSQNVEFYEGRVFVKDRGRIEFPLINTFLKRALECRCFGEFLQKWKVNVISSETMS